MILFPSQIDRRFPKVIGHRGCAGLAPENTLIGFQKALDLGVNGVEFDVHLTKDQQVVVHHDIKLNPARTQDAQGRWIDPGIDLYLRDLTLSDLQKYDVGQVKPGSYEASYYANIIPIKNQRIPTLAQVLKLINKSHDKNLEILIEAKTSPIMEDRYSDPDTLIFYILSQLKEHGLINQARLLSFDFRSLAIAKQNMPNLKIHYLTDPEWISTSVWLREFKILSSQMNLQQFIKSKGGSCWSPYFKDNHGKYLTSKNVKAAKAENLDVIVWTVNQEKDLQAMINLGVDGIITDRPDILLKLLQPTGHKTSQD